ncbi:hypothetical protein GLAREA_11267 [Glarea lozoyensis ATCC 20868]|uniref:Uncharacterized protein n=1 Tax=Glarea lozoyensis (strain ATCC 20868 / MF5171) TaxID=1116229 RepID=S3DAS0_GLAL2|nr:uncharacterized protein GLAREA_11267 [Glarea lozoyensis ATCC 20868]EPE35567.1 hypothetical protein GLAREA_11267 [Glarea lozoyensis ATCC 20868]
MAAKDEAGETNNTAILRVPKTNDVAEKEPEEMAEKYDQIIDKLHHLSVQVQIHRLTKIIDNIHKRDEECKLEIRKYDRMIKETENCHKSAKKPCGSLKLALATNSATLKTKRDLAARSNDLVDELEACKAWVDRFHIQNALYEEKVKVGQWRIEVFDLKIKSLAVQKSLDNNAVEIEACHSKILQLKATLPQGNDNSCQPAMNVLNTKHTSPDSIEHEMTSMLETLQDITRSIQALVGNPQNPSTDPPQKLPVTPLAQPTMQMATGQSAPAYSAYGHDEARQLRERVEQSRYLFHIGKEVRARKLVMDLDDQDRNNKVKLSGNRSAHEGSVLADAALCKFYRSSLGNSANKIDMEKIYGVSEDVIWENRENLTLINILGWKGGMAEWEKKGHVTPGDREKFDFDFNKFLEELKDSNGAIDQKAYNEKSPDETGYLSLLETYYAVKERMSNPPLRIWEW